MNKNGINNVKIKIDDWIYFEDFIIGGDFYSSSHFVTYEWQELLDNLSAR